MRQLTMAAYWKSRIGEIVIDGTGILMYILRSCSGADRTAMTRIETHPVILWHTMEKQCMKDSGEVSWVRRSLLS